MGSDTIPTLEKLNELNVLEMLNFDGLLLYTGLFAFIALAIIGILYFTDRREILFRVLGVVFLIMSPVAYFYVVPTELNNNLSLPSNFAWIDEGTLTYYAEGATASEAAVEYTTPAQYSFEIAEYYAEADQARLEEQLRYRGTGELVESPEGLPGVVNEYYWIDTATDSYEYINLNAGSVFPPAGSYRGEMLQIGWVESTAGKHNEESTVLIRNMKVVERTIIGGLEVWVWESVINDVPVQYHGADYTVSETYRLTVDPHTGYLIGLERDLALKVGALESYIEEGRWIPDILNSLLLRLGLFLDPIIPGESDALRSVVALSYATSEESLRVHAATAQTISETQETIRASYAVVLAILGIVCLLLDRRNRSNYGKIWDDEGPMALQPSYRGQQRLLEGPKEEEDDRTSRF